MVTDSGRIGDGLLNSLVDWTNSAPDICDFNGSYWCGLTSGFKSQNSRPSDATTTE